MRLLSRAWLVLLLAVLCNPAQADDMDPVLSRLRLTTGDGLPAGCETTAENGLPRSFCRNEEAFQALMSDYAGSLMSQEPTPAATLGTNGLSVSLESTLTGIDSGAPHVQLGTEGDSNASLETCDGENGLGCNRFPDSLLFWTHVSVRKGLPLGFQLGIRGGHLWSTSLWSLGAEVQWALLEGLNRGAYRLLPDLAIRAAVQTVVGSRDFTLTIPSAALVVSKPIGVSGTFTITPIATVQGAWVLADSNLVDLTPDINAYDECRPDPSAPTGGCTRTDPLPDGRQPGEDYVHTVTFDPIRAFRLRAQLAVQGQYEFFLFTAGFAVDLVPPGNLSEDIPESASRQWTASLSVGARM